MSNWANRTRTELTSVSTEELKPLGNNFSPITKWYRTKPVDAESAKKGAVEFEVNANVEGKFEGTFTAGQHKITYAKLETADGLIAVPVNGNMKNQIANAVEGSTVKITYLGKQPMKTGKFAGTKAHQYLVVGSARKAL